MDLWGLLNMTMEIALRIQKLRTGQRVHTYRKIAEVICDEFPNFDPDDQQQDLRGNQLYGQYLCREAMTTLYSKPWYELSDEIRNEWDS